MRLGLFYAEQEKKRLIDDCIVFNGWGKGNARIAEVEVFGYLKGEIRWSEINCPIYIGRLHIKGECLCQRNMGEVMAI